MRKTDARSATKTVERRRPARRLDRRLRILVVDDDPVIAATLRVILQNLGNEVEVAYSGEQALEIARRFCPNLLLSDVVMPGKDGVEAAIELRKSLPDCAVLLISGSAHVADLLAKARVQWMDFELMPKPVHPSELIRRIERLCNVSMPLIRIK